MKLEDFASDALLNLVITKGRGFDAQTVWDNDLRCRAMRTWITRAPRATFVLPAANYRIRRGGGDVISSYSRKYVGQRCPYCAQAMEDRGPRRATSDHIKPKSKGGNDRARNRLACCFQCNSDKGDLYLRIWLDVLQQDNDPRHFDVLLTYFDLKAKGLGDLTL